MDKNELKEKLTSAIKVGVAGGAVAVTAPPTIIPVIAASLAAAICEVLPNFKGKNQDRILTQLGIELTKLEDKIDTEFIKKDEFAYLLNKALKLAIEEIDNAKITAYINILTHSATNPEEFEQIDFYLDVLQSVLEE
jgi:hypothetical protein